MLWETFYFPFYYKRPTCNTSIRRNSLPSYNLLTRSSPNVFAAPRMNSRCALKTDVATPPVLNSSNPDGRSTE
jgi:hypothetical protein